MTLEALLLMGEALIMELVYLLAYGMLVKRNGGIRFLVTIWDLWACIITKNGSYLACLRDWIPSYDAIKRRFN